MLLARLDARHVHLRPAWHIEAEFARAADLMPAMGRFEQRLRRHAAAQDAEARRSPLPPSITTVRGAERRRGAGRGVARAAAADDRDVEIGLAVCTRQSHGFAAGHDQRRGRQNWS